VPRPSKRRQSVGSAKCECGERAIVTFSDPKRGRAYFCATHARPLFKEGLKSLPHHDWKVEEDAVRVGERWTCQKCGAVAGPKETSQRALRERLQLERCGDTA
jgi:hypothetical protein